MNEKVRPLHSLVLAFVFSPLLAPAAEFGARAVVPLHGRFEVDLKNEKRYANPFQDVLLDAVFTSPSKRAVKFFGFHDGDGKGGQTGTCWKLRFMPDEAGTWSYTAIFSDGMPGTSGTFTCVSDGSLPGPLRVDPAHRCSWLFADGTRFYPRAYMAPELFVAANDSHRKSWIDSFFGGKHRFNFCNANLLNFVPVGDVYNWQGTPYKAPDAAGEGGYVTIAGNGLFPFLHSGPRVLFDGGSNVDWLRPSIACWANAEKVLWELETRRAIWFNHWGMLGWDWSGNGRILVPPTERKAVLRYWIARLAPWWNITWNLAGEWDELMTVEEFDELGTFTKGNDPWKHPITSHALDTTLDRPWVDFRVEQFAAGTSADSIANAKRAIADYASKPVFAFETSWEGTPGKLAPEGVRTGAWGSVMGNAFYLYAECFEPTLAWGDGAAFPFVEILEDFIGGLQYWKLTPRNDLVNEGTLCLADPGREYIVYRQRDGQISLDLKEVQGEFEIEWLDPRTGSRQGRKMVRGGVRLDLPCPAAGDWALRVTKVETGAPSVKAFPTAEGFGANAVGGRCGRVIEVTTLEDSGPGSLRAALEASGPRIVVFRVSGTIALKSAIQVRAPYLTVAGQTSPGGVQVRGNGRPEGDWGVWCVNGAHDIVLRHLRVRMGGGMKHDAGNNLLFYGTAEPGIHDVIVDHCSVSWGSDTQLDWYGSYLDRATFQWNLIGEGYMGQHIGGNRAPKNITLHHNLYANLGSRTPLMQHADVFDFRNNVIYNWSGNNASVFGQFALNSSAFGNVTDNLWIAGPEGGYPYLNVGNGGPVRIDGKPAEAGGTKLYLSGNRGPRSPNGSANDWTGHGVNTWDYYERDHDGSTHLVDQAQYDAGKPFPAPPVRLDAVSILVDKVLPAVGACKPSRDAIDARIVKSVRDGTGTSRGGTTGPWPDLSSGAPAPPVDSDHDGMPDAWERAHGLDPENASDGAAMAANDYTNVENYLNELAGDAVPGTGEAPASSAR